MQMDSRDYQGSHVAITAPAANRTWEALTVLDHGDDETDPIVITFPRPAHIVAVYPSVSRATVTAAPGSLLVPSLDDILVEFSVNEETRLTNRFDTTSSPSGVAKTMVTLGAFKDSTGGARLLDYDLPGATNEIVVKFRWKTPAIKAAFESVVLGMAFHAMFKGD
jgi:hypothetical protein